MSKEGVYRTAPATSGLLKSGPKVEFRGVQLLHYVDLKAPSGFPTVPAQAGYHGI